jgi:2-keto-4-pentenoate hydratase
MVVDFQKLAVRMLANYDARTPGQLASDGFELTTAQAYALQAEITRLREKRGEQVIGYKVGCTSKPIQAQLGVKEPIFGRLFSTGCFRSGASLSYAHFANLAVEGELAVRLGKDLTGSTVSEDVCREAIESVFPVVELHHFVLHGGLSPIPQLIASSGMHAGFVLAETETSSSGLANFAHGLTVRINEVVVGAVVDSASLISPIQSLRWLAGCVPQFGLQLCRGQVILTGSPLPLYPVPPSSRIVVEVPPLGASCVEIVP